MFQTSPTCFVFDTSGLVDALSTAGRSKRRVAANRLTQLARAGRILVPEFVANELSEFGGSAALKWFRANQSVVTLLRGVKIELYEAKVRSIAHRLGGFLDSEVDVAVVCLALGLAERAGDSQSSIQFVVVVDDINFAAACTMCGVSTIHSDSFVVAASSYEIRTLQDLTGLH